MTATVVKTGLGERVLSGNVETVPFEELPVIDLAVLSKPDCSLAERLNLAQQVQTASIQTGFFYIKNTGVSQELLDRVHEQAVKFFDLPLETKKSIDNTLSSDFKGYVGMRGEQVDPAARPDLHEGWDMGGGVSFSSNSDKPAAVDGKTRQGNQFLPEDACPGFRETMLEAFDQVTKLGAKLFPIFALALDLPEDFFASKLKNPGAGSTMRVLHYPPQYGEFDPRDQGIGAHSDYEVFTILAQFGDVSALQVLNGANNWVPAPPIPGTLVLNLGDMLQRMTNGVFKSTIHRASNRTGKARYSMPFFFGLDYDALLEVIPSTVTKDRPAMYEPVTAGAYVQQRLSETYIKTEA